MPLFQLTGEARLICQIGKINSKPAIAVYASNRQEDGVTGARITMAGNTNAIKQRSIPGITSVIVSIRFLERSEKRKEKGFRVAKDLKYGKVTFEKGDIGEDEPVFVFRAQDKMLLSVLTVYFGMCLDAGSPPRHLSKIAENISVVSQWQADNYTKIPESAERGDNGEEHGPGPSAWVY